MSVHNVLRAVAACAPGKRITVFVPSGAMYALPIVPAPPPPPAPPTPIEVLSAQLLERDAQMRASVEEVAARTEETLAAVKAAVEQSTEEIVGTLHLPVKPVYFPDGKLKHAQRVKPGA